MTDAQEAIDGMWAARKMLAEQDAISFRKGLEKSAETLRNRAAQLRAMSKEAYDEGNLGRKLQLEEMRGEFLQIAAGLLKLKPEKAS